MNRDYLLNKFCFKHRLQCLEKLVRDLSLAKRERDYELKVIGGRLDVLEELDRVGNTYLAEVPENYYPLMYFMKRYSEEYGNVYDCSIKVDGTVSNDIITKRRKYMRGIGVYISRQYWKDFGVRPERTKKRISMDAYGKGKSGFKCIYDANDEIWIIEQLMTYPMPEDEIK